MVSNRFNGDLQKIIFLFYYLGLKQKHAKTLKVTKETLKVTKEAHKVTKEAHKVTKEALTKEVMRPW